MLLTMAVGLFTSRVVLQQLGVNDYGIYNVVGGIVTMFTMVSGAMTTAISRFLNFELGKGNTEKLRSVFSTSIFIQAGLAIVVLVLIETVGVWFLNEKLRIAPQRLWAANWVLQCSALTFVVNMLSVPYTAAIIAHERMRAFAYISIVEALLKLAVAFMLFQALFDSLVAYAVLTAAAALVVRWIYSFYCKRNFQESRLEWKFNRGLVKEMTTFSGWNFIGSSSAILRDQGVNVLLNLFFGTAVNAAQGVAVQVNSLITRFTSNFMIAVNPQIVKLYANDQKEEMLNLVRESSRFSFYLLLFLSLPVIFETQIILDLWLGKNVPTYAVSFIRLVLLVSMSESLSMPLQFANHATGNIKTYQLIVGGLQLLNFPIAWIGLRLGFSPNSVYVIALIISQFAFFARLVILRKKLGLRVRTFITKVYMNVLAVGFCAAIIPIVYAIWATRGNEQTWSQVVFTIILCLACSAASTMFIGLNANERRTLLTKLTHRKGKHSSS